MDSRVAQRIRELIVEGALPPGARVAEAAIAERLGVSRTPVRNALPALASEGLLEPAGKRGFAVRNFTVEDSYRATEIRCVLEGYAARELAAREDRGPIVSELRETLGEGDKIFAKGHVVKDDAAKQLGVDRASAREPQLVQRAGTYAQVGSRGGRTKPAPRQVWSFRTVGATNIGRAHRSTPEC